MSQHYTYTPDIWPPALTALFLLLLAGYGWRRRRVPGAIPFAISCVFAFGWAVGLMMQAAAVDPAVLDANLDYLIDAQVPDLLVAWTQANIESRLLFLLVLNLFLIVVGALTRVAPCSKRMGLASCAPTSTA